MWKLGPESRFEGTSFIIFPGNVGTAEALKDAAAILMYESLRQRAARSVRENTATL